MKLVPKSIVARTAWVLSIGFLLIVIDTALISALVFKAESKSANMFEMGVSIKVLANLLSNTPGEQRQETLNYHNNPNLEVVLHGPKQPPIEESRHWGTGNFQKHIMEHFDTKTIKQVFIRHRHQEKNLFSVTVTAQLNDGDWVEFHATTPQRHTQKLLYTLGVLAMFFLGVYLLALLLSRQIIRPIRQFSTAAMQFSTDINAAPIKPEGPSETRQAAAAFNLMQERIRRFVTERVEMSAAISHDLRTPLTRLRLRLESMENQEQKDKALHDIEDMQSILDSTLAFAREESQTEKKVTVDLAALLQTLCDDFSDAGAKVLFTGPAQQPTQCRPSAMKRAFSNLIDNAIKYGGEAKVELVAKQEQLQISISDSGPGIPQSEWEKVFTPFYRLEKSRNRATGGSGLGLSLARTVIRSHGGDIQFDIGNDNIFIVTIYIPKTGSEDQSATNSQTPDEPGT